MTFPKKAKIKQAVPNGKYPHEFSHVHITTSDYFKMGINFRLPVPSDNDFEMQNKSFCRLMPMAVPSFAQAKVHQRMYFVPFSRIQKSYNDMVECRPHAYDSQGNTFNIPTTYRYVMMSDIVSIMSQTSYVTQVANVTDPHDFELYDSTANPTTTYWSWNEQGKQLFNMLVQLGIKPEMCLDKGVSSKDYPVNIMPLLALARIYIDYYYPNNYEDTAKYVIESILNSNAYGLEGLNQNQFGGILTFVSNWLFYDNDYFTSAWDNPVGPNTPAGSANIIMHDVTLPNRSNASKSVVTTTASNTDGTPIINQENNAGHYPAGFSQYIDTALKRVTDYVTRNRLVGSRIVDRFLARFGIKLNDSDLNRSVYIGDYSYNIQYGDVMSNADTIGSGSGGAVLGSFAGKGIGYGESDKFTYHNNEAGIYIGLTFIIPKIGYYQGIDRFALCVNRYDFWTPEFDNLGVDAIAQGEIYQPLKRYSTYDYNPATQIFGYQPRYSWLKKKLDTVSGEFLFESSNAGLDAWHLMREMKPALYHDATKLDFKHSYGFQTTIDKAQYDRNFATNKTDNFYIVNGFNCKCYNKMLPIYDTYDFDSKGKEILMDVGGKINNN